MADITGQLQFFFFLVVVFEPGCGSSILLNTLLWVTLVLIPFGI